MDDVLAFSESSLKNLARESNAYFQMNEQRKEEKEREMYILFSSLFSLLPFVSYSVGKLSMKREQARSLGIYRTPDLKGSSTSPLILQLKRNHKWVSVNKISLNGSMSCTTTSSLTRGDVFSQKILIKYLNTMKTLPRYSDEQDQAFLIKKFPVLRTRVG